MAYPEEYYKNAEIGAIKLTREELRLQRKKERKEYREKTGCSGCYHRKEEIFGLWGCKLKLEAGPRGFCQKWWDIRNPNKPE